MDEMFAALHLRRIIAPDQQACDSLEIIRHRLDEALAEPAWADLRAEISAVKRQTDWPWRGDLPVVRTEHDPVIDQTTLFLDVRRLVEMGLASMRRQAA